PLPKHAAEDSISLLPALTAQTVAPLRKTLVHHSANGTFAIRQGLWKLIMAPDSGGWSEPKPNTAAAKALAPVQLYHMHDDGSELRNQQAEHPEIVTRMTKELLQQIANGSTRSAEGL
ncbi:MAG: arylsulfatase, partial [Verrucomicrobiota bacterium]